MALTKVGGGVLRQPIDVGIITATSVNASGIVTAGTIQVGSATTQFIQLVLILVVEI